MAGIAINGSLGFVMVLTVLLRLGDMDAVLAENPAFPFMAIFHQAVQSRAGAAVLASIVMVLTISANVGFSASTSRICWAFARDRGLPGWRQLSKVTASKQPNKTLIDKILGQRPHFDPCQRCSRHQHHRKFIGPHQHWIDHRFQWRHLSLYRWSLLVLPSYVLPPSIPSLHWCHSSQQRSIRLWSTIRH